MTIRTRLKPAPDAEEQTDGRRRRSDANRRRIAQAMIDLAYEGQPVPSAERIAERAGVGRRTVFRLFSDMEGLYREMHALMLERLAPILSEEIAGADWRARLDQMIERRARLFEEMLPVKSAADAFRHQSSFLQSDHEEMNRMLRGIILFTLPKTIAEDRTLVEAIDLAMSAEAWRRLRQDQRLSAKAATAVIQRTVAALLG